MQQKIKKCKSCGKDSILWSKGRCKICASKEDSKPLKQSKNRIKQVSDTMSAKLEQYYILQQQFLKDNPICQVCNNEPSTEIHHMKNRTTNLLNVDTFLAVSRQCHRQIHDNPQWAYENGFLLSRLN